MKFIFYILFVLIIVSCLENKTDDNSPIVLVEASRYPEYKLKENKSSIVRYKNKGSVERINLGKYNTDSVEYEIITKFSLIPVVDGLRGKSRLYLIIANQDTVIYEADSYMELPVDIYKNHFVFKKESGEYIMTKASIISEEIICFGREWNSCIVKA